MKTILNIIIYPAFALVAFACFALSPQAGAQVCEQGCDLDRDNTFLGNSALSHNGFFNTAVGAYALTTYQDDAFAGNTAVGAYALTNLSDGTGNTALGSHALYNSRGGPPFFPANNTAVGDSALRNNMTGSNNIAVGYGAGKNLTTGSNNIIIGALGSSIAPGESNKIRIGRQGMYNGTFIAGIRGQTFGNGVGVIVSTTGQLGQVVSSARFKEAIKPMDKASEAILALKPVTFRYKKELDPEGIRQFGLVAEDVEKVDADLVARDADGKVNTVRYEAVNAMLLNEFLKEHQTVQELKKQVAELTAGLQKVSAQLEVSKAAPQTVLNNR